MGTEAQHHQALLLRRYSHRKKKGKTNKTAIETTSRTTTIPVLKSTFIFGRPIERGYPHVSTLEHRKLPSDYRRRIFSWRYGEKLLCILVDFSARFLGRYHVGNSSSSSSLWRQVFPRESFGKWMENLKRLYGCNLLIKLQRSMSVNLNVFSY